MKTRQRIVMASLAISVALGACALSRAQTTACFTDAERLSIVAYWNAPGRYLVESSPDLPQRVNITVPGSVWYSQLNRLVAARPKGDADATVWTTWLKIRLSSDKEKISLPRADSVVAVAEALTVPPPIPAGLQVALGDPPPFYELVHPQRYTITFAPADASAPFAYTDNIPFANRASYFSSYRRSDGVIKPGKRVRDAVGDEKVRIDALFASAGRNDTDRRVLQAVSTLEGGFESINTYDTGFVSVGLIQFIFAKNGDGSLASVLEQLKKDDAASFQADFRRFGIDVDGSGVVDAVQPTTGLEVHGADAVQAIIADKRLTAVFERAGGHDPFRKAQLVVAMQQYWPGDDIVSVPRHTLFEQGGGVGSPTTLGVYFGDPDTLPDLQAALSQANGKHKGEADYRAWIATDTVSGPVSSFVKSEAGLATLMDRKVNRGNIGSISQVAAAIMTANHLTNLSDLAPYERTLLQAMRYRADFLRDSTLTQPPAPAVTSTPATTASLVSN